MLISSSDPAMLEVQSNFIDAAKKAGVKHVVKLSGIMPEVDSPFRFARMHGLIEQKLEGSGMAFTHLRAGEFMHSYFRQVPAIIAKGALFLPMEDARIASIDVGDIAEIAAIALTAQGHEGKIYPLTGPDSLSMAEVAEKLSAATGKTIRYVNISPEDATKNRLAAGMPPYTAEALDELFAERRKGKEAQVSPVFESIVGRRPTSFDEFPILGDVAGIGWGKLGDQSHKVGQGRRRVVGPVGDRQLDQGRRRYGSIGNAGRGGHGGSVSANHQDGGGAGSGHSLDGNFDRIFRYDVQLGAGVAHQPAPQLGDQAWVGGRAGQADWFTAKRFDRYRVHLRQVMIGSHRQDHLFTPDRSGRDAIGTSAWHQDECGVGGVVLDQRQVWARRSRFGLQLHRRKAAAILRDDRPRERNIACRLIGKMQPSLDSRRVGLEVLQPQVLGLDHLPSVWQQYRAGRRQSHLSGVSFQQMNSELALE
jgi:uncharacterized protein YbjT (DUF2867 family)